MPPEVDPARVLKKTQGTLVETRPEDAVLGFYAPTGAALALEKQQFDIAEEFERIIGHARDPDPKVSLAALRHFRTVLKDVAVSGGLAGTARQSLTVTGDGNEVREVVATRTIMGRLSGQKETDGEYGAFEHFAPAATPGRDRGPDDLPTPEDVAPRPDEGGGSGGTGPGDPEPDRVDGGDRAPDPEDP